MLFALDCVEYHINNAPNNLLIFFSPSIQYQNNNIKSCISINRLHLTPQSSVCRFHRTMESVSLAHTSCDTQHTAHTPSLFNLIKWVGKKTKRKRNTKFPLPHSSLALHTTHTVTDLLRQNLFGNCTLAHWVTPSSTVIRQIYSKHTRSFLVAFVYQLPDFLFLSFLCVFFCLSSL